MTASKSTIFNPTHLVLELTPSQIDRAWSKTATADSPASRWQSYLNQAMLDTVLPWLKDEVDSRAKVFSQIPQSDLWSVLDGTAIELEDARIVLIPSEAEDLSELRVPQEWVDLPELAADYYLAVQVSVDANFVRIWGYATHQQLKSTGDFDYSDRTYNLAEANLITDINALWVARELCPDEVTQAAIEPVAELDSARVDNLIERLGSQSEVLPRLAVPFATWGALIQSSCSRLAAARRGAAVRTPVLQWLQQGMTNLSAEFGWRQIEMAPSMVGARGKATKEATAVLAFGLAKKLTIAQQPYELKILPLEEAGSWRFELSCLKTGCMIPSGYKLKLLTEDLEDFEGNEHVATEPVEHLCLELDLEPGESLVWQIEPTPDNYQPEVLQF